MKTDPDGAVVAGGLRIVDAEGGAVRRLVLSTPPANILDSAKIGAITTAFRDAAREREIRAIVIDSDGDHFSFGASVEEHLPGRFEEMIPKFHEMFREMLGSSLVILAAVKGRCLGGGLELASFCHRVFASADTKLAQPEIVLGVLAPVASVVLPERIGRARAEELCVSGRTVRAEEALRIGLVDEIVEDPSAAVMAYAREHLVPRSGSSLRHAVRAARAGWDSRFRDALAESERIYVDRLMTTRDAEEGLRAFVEKRSASWSHS